MSTQTKILSMAAGLFAFGLVPCMPARAWGPDGHRIVCAIAWMELTPQARSHAQTILHVDGRDAFAESCTWVDAYTGAHPETAAWHKVSVPTGATAVDMARDCKQESCVLARISADTNALRRRKGDAAEHLRFLMHFVADVHQPLNVAYAADRNGADLKGLYFLKPTDLHTVWDSSLLLHEARPWLEVAQSQHDSVTALQRLDFIRTKPGDWANESLAIARAPATAYAPHGDTFEFDDEYTRVNLPVAELRLKQAGVRLGAMLNDIFRK